MLVFTRDYCTPCQVMKPWVREIAEEHTGLDVVSVNVDRKKNERFGSIFKVSAVPMLIYTDGDGKVVRRVEGIASKEQMKSTLRGLGWSD